MVRSHPDPFANCVFVSFSTKGSGQSRLVGGHPRRKTDAIASIGLVEDGEATTSVRFRGLAVIVPGGAIYARLANWWPSGSFT
jgi:hypothetical protein